MTKIQNMYSNLKTKLMSGLKNKRGQGMIEYILIVALIGVVLIFTLGNVGGVINEKFITVQEAISGEGSGGETEGP